MAAPQEVAEATVKLFNRGLVTEEEAVEQILEAYPPGGLTRESALRMLHPGDEDHHLLVVADDPDKEDPGSHDLWLTAEEHDRI